MKKVVISISIELPEEATLQIHSDAVSNGQAQLFTDAEQPSVPSVAEPPMTRGQHGKLYFLGNINPDPTLTKTQAQDLIGKLLKEQAEQKRQPTAQISKESIKFENEDPLPWEQPVPVKKKRGRPPKNKVG